MYEIIHENPKDYLYLHRYIKCTEIAKMIQNKPNVAPEGRYELKQAAASLEIDRSTLLRYTYKGKIRCSIRKSNGRRIWTGAEIIRFWKAEY